jgi:serine/threonine protein phosphatase PrpC
LWNVLGGDREQIHSTVYRAELHWGDMLLLCTDGLPQHVSDEVICETLADSNSAERACHDLVAAANESGGSDNVTVVVASFRDISDTPTEREAEVILEATRAAEETGPGKDRQSAVTATAEPPRGN